MLMTKRFPFWDMERMADEMNTMFNIFGGPLGLRSAPAGAFPALNVYDDKDKLVVTAEIPGIDPAKLELTVLENSLTLAGKREDETQTEDHQYFRRERTVGEFKRTITLSEKVDTTAVTASYKNGILRIELPKAQVAKARAIEVKAQ